MREIGHPFDQAERFFVVITKDRPSDLQRCLTSVRASIDSQGSPILVVDSSTVCREEVAKVVSDSHGIYLRSEIASTTHQRNQAIRLLEGNIPRTGLSNNPFVHFLDDDVVISPGYVANIERCMTESGYAGGTGRQVNAPESFVGPWWRRALLLSSDREGRLLRSGVNVGVGSRHSASLAVDWLPGCSMSFSLEAIRGLRFDERSTGYVLGEDIQFSRQVARLGALGYCGSAEYVHNSFQEQRLPTNDLISQRVQLRFRLAQDDPGVNPWLVAYSFIGEIVLDLAAAIRNGNYHYVASAVRIGKVLAQEVRKSGFLRTAA